MKGSFSQSSALRRLRPRSTAEGCQPSPHLYRSPQPPRFNGTRPCGDHRIQTGSPVDDGLATPVLRSSTRLAELPPPGRSARAATATPESTELERHLLDRVAGALAGRLVDNPAPRRGPRARVKADAPALRCGGRGLRACGARRGQGWDPQRGLGVLTRDVGRGRVTIRSD